MGFMHIPNLYRPEGQTILLFRECYALEKIHGTSAHLNYIPPAISTPLVSDSLGRIDYFSGGESHSKFVSLFNNENLLKAFKSLAIPCDKSCKIYGEAYGGKQQGMSDTYGKLTKFIVFDVQVGDVWLNVPDAESFAQSLGLEFVHYVRVSTDLKALDTERDAPSVQSVRNGVTSQEEFMSGKGKPREGVVLRPLIEVTLNSGDRVICKHKGDAFKETATPRPVVDPSKLQILEDSNAIANEWVTMMRLDHVLQKITETHDMTLVPKLILAMTEDVFREGKGEFVESEMIKKSLGKKTVELYRQYLNSKK